MNKLLIVLSLFGLLAACTNSPSPPVDVYSLVGNPTSVGEVH